MENLRSGVFDGFGCAREGLMRPMAAWAKIVTRMGGDLVAPVGWPTRAGRECGAPKLSSGVLASRQTEK